MGWNDFLDGAVRRYKKREIEFEKIKALKEEIHRCNEEGKTSIQLILNESKAFSGFTSYFAGFRNVNNYIAIVEKFDRNSQEKLGYYGQHIVLMAQQLGLNTCWVGVTFRKAKCPVKIQGDEELICLIALGYGDNLGKAHESKPMEALSKVDGKLRSSLGLE